MVINPIVGVYIPIIRIPIKGGMTIPNIATFDHSTYEKSCHSHAFLQGEALVFLIGYLACRIPACLVAGLTADMRRML